MKTSKIIFVISFIFCVLNVNAQKQEGKTPSKGIDTSELSLTVKVDSTALATKLIVIQGVLEVEINMENQIIVIKYDEKKGETVYENIRKISKKINAELVKYVELVEDTVAVEQVKFNPAIDKFLNIEDESIFSDEKFMNLSDEQIHQRNKDYYSLIHNIYRLKKLLEEVSNLPIGKNTEAKQKLTKALEIINDVKDNTDKCYKSFLSPIQKDFYRNLVNQFNELYNDIYE
jgi:hypothetical protein